MDGKEEDSEIKRLKSEKVEKRVWDRMSDREKSNHFHRNTPIKIPIPVKKPWKTILMV